MVRRKSEKIEVLSTEINTWNSERGTEKIPSPIGASVAIIEKIGHGAKQKASPERGRLGGGKKALPPPLPVPPRRDLRQEGLKKTSMKRSNLHISFAGNYYDTASRGRGRFVGERVRSQKTGVRRQKCQVLSAELKTWNSVLKTQHFSLIQFHETRTPESYG